MRAWWYLLITVQLVWGNQERFENLYENSVNTPSREDNFTKEEDNLDASYNPEAVYTRRRRRNSEEDREKRQQKFHAWGGKRYGDEDDEENEENEYKDNSVENLSNFSPYYTFSNSSHEDTLKQHYSKRSQKNPAFSSWAGKRDPEIPDNLDKRAAFYNYLSQHDVLSPGKTEQSIKRYPSFNSWAGKRAAAFNSWGGKRAAAFNSWGAKRAAAFNSWGGKRAAALKSWGRKRSAAFNSWGGKRPAAFNSWGGKRAAAFNSWGGKRTAAFNSWGGKRAAAFNSWGGKRAAAFNSWGGKRGNSDIFDSQRDFENKLDNLDDSTPPSYNNDYLTTYKSAHGDEDESKILNVIESLNQKRSALFNSRADKRSAAAFNSWGGKRSAAFNSWGGKRGAAFNSWGGKRSAAFNSWGGKRSNDNLNEKPNLKFFIQYYLIPLLNSNNKNKDHNDNQHFTNSNDFSQRQEKKPNSEIFHENLLKGNDQNDNIEVDKLYRPLNLEEKSNKEIVNNGIAQIHTNWQQPENLYLTENLQEADDEENKSKPLLQKQTEKRNPLFSSWYGTNVGLPTVLLTSGKRRPAFSSWGGKRSEHKMSFQTTQNCNPSDIGDDECLLKPEEKLEEPDKSFEYTETEDKSEKRRKREINFIDKNATTGYNENGNKDKKSGVNEKKNRIYTRMLLQGSLTWPMAFKAFPKSMDFYAWGGKRSL